MAWSWSHTNDAYAAAERNLRRMDRDTLETILAEWTANDPLAADADYSGFSNRQYELALADIRARVIPTDSLADTIWDAARDHATCDNGGWNAWMCPYGCDSHTVPFDDQEDN